MALRLACLQLCRCVHSWQMLHVRVPFYTMFILLTLIQATCTSPTCPPIRILMESEEDYWQCPRGCDPGFYCYQGQCSQCALCQDPYTLAEMGVTEMFIIPACINAGFCPRTCASTGNSFSKTANATLCDCLYVTTQPAPEPTPIVCKDGCNHGSCAIQGECVCDDGWKGELCDQCVPDCVNGHCNSSSGECICSSGWGGPLCDQDETYCGNNQPCLNGGTCLDNDYSDFICQCVEDFTGTICEHAMILLLCEESCSNNGSCVEMEPDSYRCQCRDGFTGTNCTAETESTNPVGWVVIAVILIVFIVALVLVIYCCRTKLKWSWPLNNDSDIQLIGKPLTYELDSENTVLYLKDLHMWTDCSIRTCCCLTNFPVQITSDMKELPVSDLHKGFTYNFEICRQTSSLDAEESGASAADCDVIIPGGSMDGEDRCTGTFADAMNSIPLRRSLNNILATNDDLRKCISDFFGFANHHREVFEKPGAEYYTDDLNDIVRALNKLDCTVESLLSHIEKHNPGGTAEFVMKLTEAHPTCKVCPRIRHHVHGGITVWKAQRFNDVLPEPSTNSTSIHV